MKVHNHGPREGLGLDCPERLIGACVREEIVQQATSDTLTARTEALNRVAAENDRLRATLTRVERLAFQWSEKADDAELMAISRKGLSDEPGLRAFATIMRRRAAEISVALEGP